MKPWELLGTAITPEMHGVLLSVHGDFLGAAFRAIADEVGAILWVDMAHFAGLVAAGLPLRFK